MTAAANTLKKDLILDFIKAECDSVGCCPRFTTEEANGADFIRQQFHPNPDRIRSRPLWPGSPASSLT